MRLFMTSHVIGLREASAEDQSVVNERYRLILRIHSSTAWAEGGMVLTQVHQFLSSKLP